MKFVCDSEDNRQAERLVAMNFRGFLPAYIAVEIHQTIKDAERNVVGDIEERQEIFK